MEMFKILGLTPKAAFSDDEQPVSLPDPIIEERKKKEMERAQQLAEARAKHEGFTPRKVTLVD
jgi:biotin synthase